MGTIDQEYLQESIEQFLCEANCLKTYTHCIAVGDYAYKLAERFMADPHKAQIAGYLHDISAIYPDDQRVAVANKMGIALCKEELTLPMIIHQKISREIALGQFNITDLEILSAIECHTTLKGNYSTLDLVVFIADKIKWDQDGEPPYITGLMTALDHSLESAAYYYIDYLLNHDIQVIHPWLNEAYVKLKQQLESA
ncbi:bis(5'-nucleosyl)-tetraphosphatase (symmetrical) YqeK [Enterococcus rotai]|uniref:bis(5'-nucleosyl)-tetraphosphatase (symmetrical) YqeK n=1 Tax=Enterococcus rotai TaxID=118060 RepID=UPI0035C7215D